MPKSKGITDLLSRLTGRDHDDSIRNSICTTCGGSATSFNDDLSAKEYTISGMCQTCQDAVFNSAGEEF